jgi:coenzyme Q-binding protein COQ10
MASATRSIVINAPPERVFDVIADYEHYPEFLPEVKSIRTSARQGSQVDIHYEVDVMKRIKYTLRMTEDRPKGLKWTFVEGEVMKDNTGGWVLEAQPDGKTKAIYTVDVALGMLVPKALVTAMVESSLPKMLEAFKKRIEAAK